MPNTIIQLLLQHLPFRRRLAEELSIQAEDIDDMKTDYDRSVESQDSWFSLIVVCKNGGSHNISARRTRSWEFKR
jgi:hypothetical protein